MPIIPELYDPAKIDRLKKLLEMQASKGQARFFEIYVDSLKVVPRTSDVAEFDSFEEFVTEDTQKVRILLYSTSPTSPRNDQFIFTLKETPVMQMSSGTLNGFDIDAKIKESVSIERERWDTEQLKKELDGTKGKLTEAEEYIETLESELERYRSKKLHLGDINLGELASVVVEGMIRRNPKMLAKIPGGESLAGIIEQDNKEKLDAAEPGGTETQVSFKKKEERSGGLTEEEQNYIRVIRQMEEHFDEAQLQKVMLINQSLAEDTSRIEPVASLLDIKPEAQNNEEQ